MKLPLLRYCLVTGFVLACRPVLAAAPLDALNQAYTHTKAGQHLLELGVDAVNDGLDVLKIRSQTSFAGTNAGDYAGQHIKAGIGVTDRLWLEGSLWDRSIQYNKDQFQLDSWQMAAQYRLNEALPSQLTWALRLSAWGNGSSAIQKSSSTTVSGVTFDNVSVANPQDSQNQVDLLFSTAIGENTRLHGFAGMGRSKVSVEALEGVTDVGYGCRYNLRIDQQFLTGKLVAPCTFGSGFFQLPATIKLPISSVGLDPVSEFNYTARYSHVGGSVEYADFLNRFRVGLEYQKIDRGPMDVALQKKGGTVIDDNVSFVVDYARRMGESWAVFLRGQLMMHQFAGDIPMAYNNFTASRFNQQYGFVSAGVILRLW